MSFLDNVNYGQLVPITTSQHPGPIVADTSACINNYLLMSIILILYCYQVYLAFLIEYRSGHLLRNIFTSLFYIPISCYRIATLLVRASVCVFVYFRFFRYYFTSDATHAPSPAEQTRTAEMFNEETITTMNTYSQDTIIYMDINPETDRPSRGEEEESHE